MTLKELSEKIESQEFIAEFSVLSGFNTVLSALENNDVVSELIGSLQNNIDNQSKIIERIEQLLPQYTVDYMHPYDISILGYIFALNEVNNQILIDPIASKFADINELWWSRKFAEKTIYSAQMEFDEA